MEHDTPHAHADEGGDLLARISNEMVRAQKQYFGKGPTKAKSYLVDDLLIIVMRGGLTTAERTMLDFEQHGKVRDFRQTFQNEMTGRLSDMIEDVTGRKVLTYQSQILFDPDMVVEVFVFDEAAVAEGRAHTAHGQVDDRAAGEATDTEALDPPSESGQ